MGPEHYAVVAYVTNALGRWVENLRSELYPEYAHLAAHITVLPPRMLIGAEDAAKMALQELCARIQPFEVDLGAVETFSPTTPTVFLQVSRGAYRMRELHDLLNVKALHAEEEWPYMPHMTIVKMPTLIECDRALGYARQRWQKFEGSRSTRIERLTFVREGQDHHWFDLGAVPLGQTLAPTR